MNRLTQRAIVVCALAVITSSASAQTNDALYGSWTWATDVVGPRAGGAGGAAIATRDDASNMALNPAVLSTLTRTEFLVSGYEQSARSGLRGDEALSVSGPHMIGGAALLSPKLALGGFLLRPRATDTALNTEPLQDSSHLSGSLRSVVTDVGAALSWHPTKRTHLGAELVVSHLELQGSVSRFNPAGGEDLRVSTAAGNTKVFGTFGALVELTPSVTVGGSVLIGTNWRADRNAFSPAGQDAVVGPGSQYQVRRPLQIAGGANWQATRHLRFAGQIDYVAYSQVQNELSLADRTVPGGYQAGDAVEPRVGAELSLPIGSGGTIQVRAGVHLRGANAIRYVGGEPIGLATFPGAARAAEASAGASLLLNTVALDLSYSSGSAEDASHLLAGLSFRF